MTGRLMALVLMLACLPAAGNAQERGSAEEAQALVARATAYFDTAGQEAAFAAFEAADGGFKDRDLYVFVYSVAERAIAAHGANAALVGVAAETLVDVDGVPFANNFLDDSTEEGSWMDYKWQDPISGEVLAKTSWIVRHRAFVFGVGIYKL
jgi:cytochrome c